MGVNILLSLKFGEKRILRVFEKGVLRAMFGRKWDEVTGEWKKLQNGEIHNYIQPQISLGRSNQEECNGRVYDELERGETCKGFSW
jgi:hypothetical protein